MPRIIAIMNQKGGVGKTTTTLNLGAALAHRGKRVLLIDLDPQANLSMGLGTRAADLSTSVYELLTDPKADAMNLAVQTRWERLSVIPSHIDLSGAEIEMVTMIGRESRLSKSIERAKAHFDYILIDCLPSLSLLTVNAMAAATEVFVPLQAHPFALEGLGKLFEVVGMIREAMNPVLKVSGVLVTMFDGRTNVSKITLDSLRKDERLREHIFRTTVKQNIKIAESQKDGIPVIAFDPACHASKAYFAMCEEVLEMESGCYASECFKRIITREFGQQKQTFSADLVAQQPGDKELFAAAAPPPAPPVPVEVPRVENAPVVAASPDLPVSAANTTPMEPPPAVSLPATTPIAEIPPTLAAVPIPEISTAPLESVVIPPAPQTVQIVEAVREVEFVAPAVLPAPEIAPIVATQVTIPAPQEPPAEIRNLPDAESIHPSMGLRTPAGTVGLHDPAVLAQAAQSGIVLNRFALPPDINDENYRPRLGLKPGSCKVSLPAGE